MNSLIIVFATVIAILSAARRSLNSRCGITMGVRSCHYLCLAYLAVMNISGVRWGVWAIGRSLRGELTARLGQHFIVLREMPPVMASTIWAYLAMGETLTVILACGIARLHDPSRRLLLILFPLLVASNMLAGCIGIIGSEGIDSVESRSAEWAVAFAFCCVIPWPYICVYCFYRSSLIAKLFQGREAE